MSTFTIAVRMLDGRRYSLRVSPRTTIGTIKRCLRANPPICHPHQYISLIWAGKELEDDKMVASYGVEFSDGTTIFAIVRTPQIVRNQTKTTQPRKWIWLLIKGCTNVPNGISVSKRKGFNGNYLYGMKYDFANMQEFIEKDPKSQLFNMVSNMQSLKKQQVLDAIAELCRYEHQHCREYLGICIYYTGHGQTNTGNWCFSDGVVCLDDVLRVCRMNRRHKSGVKLYLDCCYSGEWALDVRRYKEWSMKIKAASWPGKVAFDNKENGGYFTCFVSKKSGVADSNRLNWCWSTIHPKNKFTIKYMTASGVTV